MGKGKDDIMLAQAESCLLIVCDLHIALTCRRGLLGLRETSHVNCQAKRALILEQLDKGLSRHHVCVVSCCLVIRHVHYGLTVHCRLPIEVALFAGNHCCTACL